jgi:hypothetical protein
LSNTSIVSADAVEDANASVMARRRQAVLFRIERFLGEARRPAQRVYPAAPAREGSS